MRKTVADWLTFRGPGRGGSSAGPRSTQANHGPDGEWLRTPPSLARQNVCLLACFSSDGKLSRHTLFVAASWRARNFVVVLIVATDRPARFDAASLDRAGAAVDGLVVRLNSGYDFGSWAAALRARPDAREASLLAFANDSLYGPFDGFDEVLARVQASAADMVGLTDSYELQHHIQSYLVFYKPTALRSEGFSRFWDTIGAGGREDIIEQAEVPQLALMREHGITVEILFPTTATPLVNPTLLLWRELVSEGFPFMKVQLLRDNPWNANLDGWDQVLRDHGYDSELVRHHLGARFNRSPAAKALSAAEGL